MRCLHSKKTSKNQPAKRAKQAIANESANNGRFEFKLRLCVIKVLEINNIILNNKRSNVKTPQSDFRKAPSTRVTGIDILAPQNPKHDTHPPCYNTAK